MLSNGLEVSASKSEMLNVSEVFLVFVSMDDWVIGTGVKIEY
jgi:hypothetical protein